MTDDRYNIQYNISTSKYLTDFLPFILIGNEQSKYRVNFLIKA